MCPWPREWCSTKLPANAAARIKPKPRRPIRPSPGECIDEFAVFSVCTVPAGPGPAHPGGTSLGSRPQRIHIYSIRPGCANHSRTTILSCYGKDQAAERLFHTTTYCGAANLLYPRLAFHKGGWQAGTVPQPDLRIGR